MAAALHHSPSVSLPALRRQASAVRAACGSAARADPCGGRWVTGVPTATSIRMLDLASHQVTTLPESAGKFSPSWSPDGQFIKADSLDIHSLYLFDVKTQRWSTLYTGSTFAYAT